MSFLVTLALAIGLFAVFPVLAHLFRRGRAKTTDFSATHWITPNPHIAKQRSKLDDRALLSVRAALIFLFALLGSTPLLKCDRKLLGRTNGASIGRIFILDDSGSMNVALAPGKTRFELARSTALSLADQMRDGDSVGIVLASRPARLLFAPSGHKESLKAELLNLHPTCRATDLATAITLARSVLEHLPQSDKRLLIFSDLAARDLNFGEDSTIVLKELARPASDCAVLYARRTRGQLQTDFACSTPPPTGPRTLVLLDSPDSKTMIAKATFMPENRGQVTVFVDLAKDAIDGARWVKILEADDNAANDASPVITEDLGVSIGSYSDPSTGRASTGGPPVIEQALRAIDPNYVVRSLPTVPDDSRQLSSLSVLLLDDPPPLSAESRTAIAAFANRGGTAVALFGPAASSAQLGSLHLPFLEESARWETTAPKGLSLESLGSSLLGAQSLAELGANGRFVFDESHARNALVRGRWSDQKPFWLERPLGRGTLSVIGLPSSVQVSDWALRPGFLFLLTELLTARERLGHGRVVTAGQPFRFPRNENVVVTGPDGTVVSPGGSANPGEDSERKVFPDWVGRYQINFGKESEVRLALWPAEETLDAPAPIPVTAAGKTNQTSDRLDLSRYVAFAILGMLGLELLMREQGLSIARKWLRGRMTRQPRNPR